MSLRESIVTLAVNGCSGRQIARQLGINRETVGKYLRLYRQPKPAIPTLDPAGDDPSKPAISTLDSATSDSSKPAISTHGSAAGRPSVCEPWRQRIETATEAGLSAQRIYQDLVVEEHFAGSYQAVKRFVRKLKAAQPLPFRRMEVDPGAEAQIDFGLGAWVVDADGHRRRPYLLRVILSHSRKGYSEAIWHQSTEEFIRALENAFRYFGGVPGTLVPDNLRAAVKKADWFDPELNPKVREFCTHYGTVMLPTRPAMPRHKGKVESGVKYVQNNALKGRCFESLAAQNKFLLHWEETWADTRIHGTIRRQVGRVFIEVEKAALLPLPTGLFPCFEEGQRSVHRDGHVEVCKAYYSVPPEYMGRTVWVRWESRLVRIYNQRMEPICIHARCEPGKFSTDQAHIHPHKRQLIERGADWLLEQAGLIGLQTGHWAKAMYQQRGVEGIRVLQGLLSLAGKHPARHLEHAAEQALEHGLWRLRELRQLRQLLAMPPAQELFEFQHSHPLIRDLEAYAELCPAAFQAEEETNPNTKDP